MKTNFTFLKIAIRISGLFLVFLFSHVAGQAQYCTPTGDCSWGDNVYDFYTTNGVTDISNMASGCSVNGYGDFTSSDTLIIHQLRSFSVNVQTEGSYSQGFTIWIDWNQDGDFNDAGEEVWNSGSNGTQLFSGTITVPPDAATGNTVMRVMAGYLCVPTDPCNNCSSYGETEDYAVKVLPPLPFIESFETAYMPGYWTNTSASGGPWEIGNESINTPGYDNAIADHTGNSGYYAWMDFSGGDDSVVIESPILDVSSNINVVLSFYEFSYSSSGSANANWLFVECFDGTGWIKVDSILQNDPGWVKYSYNLTPYKYNAGVNLQFRFRAESGGQLYDYYNDILIDDITLFEPTQYDAGIVSIDAPAFSFEPSARDIKVSIENYGAANLTSANINYSINGGTVNTFNWTGSLPLFTKDTGVTIGNHVFPTGLHNIKAWTTSPNGNTDNNNSNDTSSITVITCSSLNGTYTVGGSTANFPDVSAAAFALNQCGISGPVIFDINPGTYTGNFEILPVPGASATNTISFQSATGDSTDVVLQTDNSSPNNWIAHLNGADYITFKQLTFDASTATANGRMIYFSNNANHNTVANCILSGSYQSGTNYAAIYGYDDLNEYNTFINNIIQNCSAGLYWRGTSSLSAGNIISNNQILNYANYGMYLYYQDAIQVTGNTIAGAATHGIYCYYLDNDILISKNDIQNAGLYGIYLYYCDGTSTNRSEVSNNFISNATGSGIYDRYPKYRDYLYNSINVPASNYGLYLYNYTSSYQGHNIFNNNIITSGSGTAIYVDEPSYVNNCDFNNYYSASGDIANFGSTGYSDLASLQAAYPTLNTNCLSVNPQFFSSTNLHIYDFDLDSAATPIAGISTDIDGETRNSTHPDIGADEFTIPPMTITDLYAEHPDTIDVGKGNTKKTILKITIVTDGLINPLSVNTLNFSTGGSDLPSDISNAQLFYTGVQNEFADTLQYGTDHASPSGSFAFTGNQELKLGINYFWLTYDISANALTGNHVDAQLLDVITGSGTDSPSQGDPAGNRKIVPFLFFDPFDTPANWTASSHGFNWEFSTDHDGNATSSSNTGPAHDHGNVPPWGFMYTEASSMGGDALLESPAFDFTGLINPEITFWYHMYGSDMGELHLDVYYDGNWHNDVMTPIIGEQQSDYTDPWVKSNIIAVPDASHKKDVKFRFRGISGPSFRGDMSIDDVSIRASDPYPADAAVSEVLPLNPVSGNQDIKIMTFNYGMDTIKTAQFNYSINGVHNATVTNYTGNLQMSQSEVISLGTYNFTPGTYEIKAWPVQVNGMADGLNMNDTAVYNFTITLDATILAMDESSIQYGSSPVNAFIGNLGTDDISSATIGWSVNGTTQTAYTWSGSLSAGNGEGPLYLGNYNFTAGTHDIKIWVEQPNGMTDMDPNNDTLVKFFTFNLDVGVSYIEPITTPGSGSIDIKLKNYGNIPLSSTSVQYKDNGNAGVSFPWSGTLNPGEETPLITIGSGTFSYGNNSIEAWTSSPNGEISDSDPWNDTLIINFDILADIGIVDGYLPQDNCNRGIDTLKLGVKNFGTEMMDDPFSITYINMNDGTTITENLTGISIPPGDTLWHTFSTPIDMTATSEDTLFNLKGFTTYALDADHNNDTMAGQVESWYVPNPPIASGTSVDYGNSAVLTASLNGNGNSLNWYDSNNNMVGNGTSFTTPALHDTTTYHVNAVSLEVTNVNSDITSGSGNLSTSLVPFYMSTTGSSFKYSKFAGLYNASDLISNGANTGTINDLAFYKTNSCGYTNSDATCNIYIKQVTDATLTSSDWPTLISGATHCYSSTSQNLNTYSGWQEFNFSTPFNWDGSSNLLIMVEWYRPNAHTCANPGWEYTTVSTSRVKRFAGSSSSNTLNYSVSSLPNIRFNLDAQVYTQHCESALTPVTVNVTNIPGDAGVVDIEPVTETGIQAVNLTIASFTSVILNQVSIVTEVNGTIDTTIWTGSLGKHDSLSLQAGNGNFSYGTNTIKAWTTNPNGLADPNNMNDTLEISFSIYSDLEMVDVISPAEGCDYGNENVTARIANTGQDTVTSFDISYLISGETSAVTENVTTVLPPGDTLTYSFTTQANLAVTQDSTFILKVYTSGLTHDINQVNDTATHTFISGVSPQAPIAVNDTVDYGKPAMLVAASPHSVSWYDHMMSVTELYKGDTFYTPVLYDTIVYYAEAVKPARDTGSLTTMFSGGNAQSGAMFDITAYKDLTIDSFNINCQQNSIVEVWYRQGSYVGHSTDPAGWIKLGEYFVNWAGDDMPTRLPVGGLSIPQGETYGIYITMITGSLNYTNGDGTNEMFENAHMKFEGGVGGAYFNLNFTPRIWNGDIYYSHNQGSGCISNRIPVTAYVKNFPSADAGVLKVNRPVDGPAKTNAELLNITVKNYGTVNVDTIPVAYVLDGMSPVTDTLFAMLAPGDTANFSFSTTMDLSTINNYDLVVYTMLNGDTINVNDTIHKTIQHTDYCISRANNTEDTDIGKVNIKHPVTGADLLNNGVAIPVLNNPLATKLYSDYTHITADLQQGQTYSMDVSQITSFGTFYSATVAVYIDFNQDGILDPTEEAFRSNTIDETQNIASGDLLIPATAKPGHTRMRVVMDEFNVSPPCGTYSYGETEDYTVNILPQVWAEAGVNDTICNTHSAVLTATGNGSFEWNTMETNASITVNPASETMYYVTVTDAWDYEAVDSVSVYVRDLPVLSYPAMGDVCVDAPSVMLDMATPAGGNYTGSGVSGNYFDPATAGVGTHTLKYIYTDMHGCTDSITQDIIVNPLPIITFTPMPDICVDASAFLLTSATPVGGTYSGPGVDGSGNFDPAVAGVGTHYIKYEYTDGNSCYNIDSTTITVLALPVISATATANPANYGTTSNLDVSVGASSYSYLWSPADSLLNPADVNIKNPVTKQLVKPTQFTVKVTDQITGCFNTSNVTVGITGGPLSATPVSYRDTICNGDTTTLYAQASGGSDAYTYSWSSSPAGFSSTAANPQVTVNGTTTYHITVDDGFNAVTESITIETWDLPTVNTTFNDTAVCYGDSALIGGYFTGEMPFTFVKTDGSNPATVTNYMAMSMQEYVHPTDTTSYMITEITDGNGCYNTSNLAIQVDIHPLPTVNILNDSIENCFGDSTQINILLTGQSPYMMYTNKLGSTDTFISTVSSNQYMPYAYDNTVGGNFYEVTKVVDAYGCTNYHQDTILIKTWELPTASILEDSIAQCFKDSMQINFNFTGTSPWNVEIHDGTAITSESVSNSLWQPWVEEDAPGIETYYIIEVEDAHGCRNTNQDSITVETLALPQPDFSGLDAEYCNSPMNDTLTGIPAGGTFTGTGMISGNVFNPGSVSGGATYDITYTYTDGNGCTNDTTKSTLVRALPTVNFTGLATDYCIDAGAATLSGSPAGGTFTGSGISGNSFDPAIAGTGTHTVSYTFTDTYGCINSSSQTVTVNPLPVVSISGIDPSGYCVDAAAFTLSGTPSGGTFSGTGITTSGSFDPDVAGAGSHIITYTYTDMNGCTNDTTGTITVHPLPVITIGTAPEYCLNAAYDTLTPSPAGGTFIGLGMSGNVFKPDNAGTGTHTITYMVTDVNGCFQSKDTTVTVNPAPTADFSGLAATYCDNDSAAVSLNGIPAGGTFTGTGISGSDFTPAMAGTGIHQITYTFTNSFGCTDSRTRSTEVLPAPSVSMSGLAMSYCANDAPDTLAGLPVNGVFSGPGMSGMTFDPDMAGTGNHTVVYTYTAMNGCAATASAHTYVNAVPVVDLSGLSAEHCITDAPEMLSGSPTGGTFTGAGVYGSEFYPDSVQPGYNIVTYTYVDANGCTGTDMDTSMVYDMPMPDLGTDTAICAGDSIMLDANASGTGFLWSTGDTIPQIFAAPMMNTTYSVMVTNGACQAEDSVRLSVSEPMVDLGPDSTICHNLSITLDAGAGYDAYIWSTGETSQSITIDSLSTGLGTHMITVIITDSLGCTDTDTIMVTIEDCTGIHEFSSSGRINIYPNPSEGIVNLEIQGVTDSRIELCIYSFSGKKIVCEQIERNFKNGYFKTFDLSTQPRGVYLIRLTGDHIQKTERIIIH